MTGYLVVRLAPLLCLVPGIELRAGSTAVAAGVPVPLSPGPEVVTVSVALPLTRGRACARLDIPVWIEPGGTTTVDLARLALCAGFLDRYLASWQAVA